MTESRIFKRGKRIVAAAALATVGVLALGAPASAAPAQAPDISITPESVDFGQVLVGEVSEEEILTFTNETGADVKVTAISFHDGPGQFESGDTFTCDVELGAIIVPASGTCEVGFVFVPQDVGHSTATIDWLHEDAPVARTELSGDGVAPCAPPTGPVSGPLHQLGSQLGPLGSSMVNLAKELCAAGL